MQKYEKTLNAKTFRAHFSIFDYKGKEQALLLVVKVVQVVFLYQQAVQKKTSPCTVEITQYALKGQKSLAQGIALGNYERKPVAL